MKCAKIAIIEDDDTLRKMYSMKFKRGGYAVIVASDGQEAVHIIKKQKPDLVLLDLLLPKKDGFEVLEEIRSS